MRLIHRCSARVLVTCLSEQHAAVLSITVLTKRVVAALFLCSGLLLSSPSLAANSFTLHNILQRVIDHYPSVENALLQVKRARYNTEKVEAQLGWQLHATAGARRDTSIFGTSSDIIDAGAGIKRKFEGGGSLEFEGNIDRTDSVDNIPGIPSPTTSTALDVRFRQPLMRGADDPEYQESLLQAELDFLAAEADRNQLYDELADQIITLHSSSLNSQAKIRNTQHALDRAERMKTYLNKRANLGLAEKQDLLQVEARIHSRKAELLSLDVIWQAQRIQLNRLMGRASDAALKLVLNDSNINTRYSLADVRQQALAYDPELQLIDTRVARADSIIRQRGDNDKNQLDLILYLGNRSISGDTAAGSTTESEVVGGVQLEYQQFMDKGTTRAEIDQAYIDKDSAFVDKRQILEDIEYDAAMLITEINSGQLALNAYRDSIRSEQAKLDEAVKRYQNGRSDTEQLINFEAELSNAELLEELQKIELIDKHFNVELLKGSLWQGINRPQ